MFYATVISSCLTSLIQSAQIYYLHNKHRHQCLLKANAGAFFFLQKLETVYDGTAHKAFFFVISATQSAASRAEKIQMIFLRKAKVASGLSEKHPVVR